MAGIWRTLALLLIGLYAHFMIDSRFRLIDYLAQQSTIAQSEGFISEESIGSSNDIESSS